MVIKVYVSGMSGNKEVKKRQQRVTMIMDSKHIEYTVIDITEPGQEGEKDFMQVNAQHKGCTISDPNPRHALPPQLFNDTEYCGDYDDFDMANEVDNLEVFLKLAAPAAPEVEHKNGGTTGEEATEATDAVVDDDENKENKTEDNTDGGAVAAEDATEDGANENTAPEAASVKAPAENTSTAADGVADEGKKEESIAEPLSTTLGDDQSDANELNENDKAANVQVVVDGSDGSEQAVERNVVESMETAVKAVDVDTFITEKEGHDDDDGDRENPQSKDALLVNESDPHETDDDSTPNSDEKLQEDTLLHTDNLVESHKSTAVSMEKDTDAEVSDGKENVGLNGDEKEPSVEAEDESGTSEDEQDSQNANNVSRLENETNVILEQGAVDEEQEENVLRKGDSTEVESLPAFDDEKDDFDVDNKASLMMPSPPTDLTKDVQPIEAPAEIEPSISSDNEEGEKDDSEIENSTEPEKRPSTEGPHPVETGSTNENSSTPPPRAAVEEPPSAVEMDADEEEQELLKTSAALAGKSEDAEEIDIEEAEQDEAAQQTGQDDAGEDGISSKLVDTDDPMFAEQEQEE